MLSSFYLVRLTWNETRTDVPVEGEEVNSSEYKTYLIGATMVGIPQFLYGRSPYATWGITSAYPDAMDLFVEDIDTASDTYLSAVTGKRMPIERSVENIAVRGSFSGVNFEHALTGNGVLIPSDLLDGAGGSLMPWATQEMMSSDKAFSVAWLLDPIVQDRMGVKIGSHGSYSQ